MAKTENPAADVLKAGQRVVATRALRDVPEGTAGTVKVANGLTWIRYWVKFDNGQWVGSVSGDDLVRESDWPEFQRRRAEEAARPNSEAAPAPASPVDGAAAAPAATGSASRVPAHLLERSQKARAGKATS